MTRDHHVRMVHSMGGREGATPACVLWSCAGAKEHAPKVLLTLEGGRWRATRLERDFLVEVSTKMFCLQPATPLGLYLRASSAECLSFALLASSFSCHSLYWPTGL